MGRKRVELTGKRFGRLQVEHFDSVNKHKQVIWLCSCDCGKSVLACTGNLRNGGTKSCGCLNHEIVVARSTVHGQAGRGRRSNEYQMLVTARARAKKRNVPFNLGLEDIHIPASCPLLEIPLFQRKGSLGPNSPTLDRIIPKLGYVKGNVRVISHRANNAKSNLTLQELKLLVHNLEVLSALES